MYQYQSQDDTIVAIATATGQGGIGIVRLSGPQAFAIADQIVKLKSGKKVSELKGFNAAYGWVKDNAQVIDEVLVTVFRGPKSYTAQDVVELSVHGGTTVQKQVLNLILNKKARLAEPGEFTKRAFLNGRIDLTQAEAVLDIINAKTSNFARVSQHQLEGDLAKHLNQMREYLMRAYLSIEAVLNFPEDDIDAKSKAQITQQLNDQLKAVESLLATANNGRLLKEGIRIVLCGKPNAGKSSLLNALLKQERAIVTNIAGTTRDVLEESAQINGIPFQLVDTAGILEPRDLIEQEAIKRSHLFIDSADLCLLVLDSSKPLEDADQILLDKLKDRRVLIVLNKSDLPKKIDESQLPLFRKVPISASNKTGIADLEQAIHAAVWHNDDIDANTLMISNLRHENALKRAQENLQQALKLIECKGAWEVIAQEIKCGVNHLDSITGRNIDTDLIDRIFAEFCIGK